MPFPFLRATSTTRIDEVLLVAYHTFGAKRKPQPQARITSSADPSLHTPDELRNLGDKRARGLECACIEYEAPLDSFFASRPSAVSLTLAGDRQTAANNRVYSQVFHSG
ncbi:uncharacterized protein CCOS01_02645 [Colletotrichum costaricense]|uniref:Uncharacterized protein n=1 Tax=Colletotrichum costaricense TaxID=1209916 RepID=A0AAJ0E7D5_9PEZI|nr:uncharacterized protein CCOS01_02645 [Colletotrichum costaricense]KAK1537325.1 hypothetical protein CCOS01_02645 [Colletotrichum costaricense]